MGEARRSYLLLLLLLVAVGAASSSSSSSSDGGGRLRSRRDFRLPLVLGDDEADAGPLPNSETAQTNSASSSSSDSDSEEGKQKKKKRKGGGDADAAAASEPLQFFEVARPVAEEGATPCSSVVLLDHSFGYTYGLPPAEAAYRPPDAADCGGGGGKGTQQWAKVVLKWRGACRGRQFDRISMVWLNGVELLRTCTAEPVAQGVVWEVEKDVTRYAALFREPGKVVVSLANVVDASYTGVFNITLRALFYTTATATAAAGDDGTGFSGPPDAVLPVTHMPPDGAPLQEGGYTQRIENASHTVSVTLAGVPRNVYRAVLEVCVSFHERDEFWYTNPPDAWIGGNKLTDSAAPPGHGPFREIVARLDGTLVGAVFPFAVVYTGGLNPYLWRPAAAIGAFALPSYDLDVSAFAGILTDGRNHTVSFGVTNALNVWLVQGNLHLWLDAGSPHTRGRLDAHSESATGAAALDAHGYAGGPDGDFTTSAARVVAHSGTVVSSHGTRAWAAEYRLEFRNRMRLADRGDAQTVRQDANATARVVVKSGTRDLVSWRREQAFPLRLQYREVQQRRADKSVHVTINLTHRFDQDDALILPGGSEGGGTGGGTGGGPGGSRFSSLRNNQSVAGVLVIFPNNTNTGAAESEQRYRYESSDGCYWRHVRARNYSVVADHVDARCRKSSTLQQQQQQQLVAS